MYYSGIDLHKRTCYITTLDKMGDLVNHGRLPNNESDILNYFTSKGGEHSAVVECTANTNWLCIPQQPCEMYQGKINT